MPTSAGSSLDRGPRLVAALAVLLCAAATAAAQQVPKFSTDVSLVRAVARTQRLSALTRIPHLVAARREDDPRGGVQSDEYRHADPREVVEEGATTMAGPGGTPQEDTSAEQRREEQRPEDK